MVPLVLELLVARPNEISSFSYVLFIVTTPNRVYTCADCTCFALGPVVKCNTLLQVQLHQRCFVLQVWQRERGAQFAVQRARDAFCGNQTLGFTVRRLGELPPQVWAGPGHRRLRHGPDWPSRLVLGCGNYHRGFGHELDQVGHFRAL